MPWSRYNNRARRGFSEWSKSALPALVDIGNHIVYGRPVGFYIDDVGLGSGLCQQGSNTDLRGIENVFVPVASALYPACPIEARRLPIGRFEIEMATVSKRPAQVVEVAVKGNAALINHHNAFGQLF